MKDKNTGKSGGGRQETVRMQRKKKEKKRKYLGIRREIQVTGSGLVVVPGVDKKQIKLNTRRGQIYAADS